MALRSPSAGAVSIELFAPEHGLADRPIAVAGRIGLGRVWCVGLAGQGPYSFAITRSEAAGDVAASLLADRQAEPAAWARRDVCAGR